MKNLEMDEFRNMLEQITDHSKPESKKSELIKYLNQQLSKDEDNCCLEAMFNKPEKQSKSKLDKNLDKMTNNIIYQTSNENEIYQSKPEESHLKNLENFSENFFETQNI